MKVITSSTALKSGPTELSPLETECLFGETVEVLDEKWEWVYCRLLTDDYYGWVNKKNLGEFVENTHRVLNKRTFIYKHQDAKSEILFYLPMGSRLVIEEIKFSWAKICFLHNEQIEIGYVPSGHIVKSEHKVKDWVSIAQQLEGTPYRWGGRDTIGLDCSALLQLCYQTYGEMIPRNTSQQRKLDKPIIYKIDDLRRGCVIFWEGHVGLMIDQINCIHANAYHMKTFTEPLNKIIDRIGKKCKTIKMLDFN